MARLPSPRLEPIDPSPKAPADLTPEQLAAEGAKRVADAAAFMGVSPRKVQELIEAGDLPSYLDGNVRLVPVAALKARIAKALAEGRT
jgi:excisionase family DNA binding protein